MRLLVSLILAFSPLTLSAQDKYAVVVGVETYDTGTFENLKYAGDDAVELGRELAALGFKLTVMTSESATSRLRPSTPKKIDSVISAVARSCASDDTLLIALSGHGVQFTDEELLPTGVRETYFCPSDANLTDKSTLVKISSIINFMNNSPASRKLLLVDACQEHVLSAEGQKKGVRRIELGSVHENRRSVPSGMAVLFSCSSGQVSWQHDPIGHGVFSYFVIEYLKGAADPRYYDSGLADLNNLVAFVSKQTNDYVIGKNLTPDGQYPVLRGSSTNWSLGEVPRAPAREIANAVGIKLVLIPSGNFMMGSPTLEQDREDDEIHRRVTISRDFYLGTTEVTQEQWLAVMGTTPWSGQDGVMEGPRFPASYVTWDDAVLFCQVLSKREQATYRLPTEAEWEYACRAGGNTAFAFGASPEDLTRYAWFEGNSFQTGQSHPHVVGNKLPNAFGLHDMHGNVAEFCSDFYDRNSPQAPSTDPKGPDVGDRRVLRGGSWASLAVNCRCSDRTMVRGLKSNKMGFRVVLEQLP